MKPELVRERFATLRAEGKRHKDAAEALGISEGEAIAAHAGDHARGLRATPLRGPWLALLQSLERCGPVLALTRNSSTVHEKTGVYRNLSGGAQMGLALGEEIDLRLFFKHWHAGFFVSEAAANAGQPAALSLQFFDASGIAVHKIFARDATDRGAFESVAQAHADAARQVAFAPAEAKAQPRPDGEIDRAGLAEAWGGMTDTHQFFGLLNKFEVERQQSFRLSEGGFTKRAQRTAVRELLLEASFAGTPIMVFVGSPGCIQIHSGPVVRIEPMEMRGMQWLNVLDPGFNLHLREDLIDSVWIVEKPTSDGVVTSVEAFDGEGGLMAMFFGTRKPGAAEREDWRALVRKLPTLEVSP
ncbi:ChuX/HutX family heme-like substrate-binding protein [Variovorax sp. J31P207]|uniref:hemin-degrading factor n=1 Tax=Variovorax sp. J31P207 TaxID=3053510 RepID=UPI002574CE01|nr:ChuX/HutX family heme-like substrate-binding protein [Variovorax sp. J31P207]MDM0069234.1 ChuX/HutX family heme-like substrate-binding protein [Variovorax sp. J31P207]